MPWTWLASLRAGGAPVGSHTLLLVGEARRIGSQPPRALRARISGRPKNRGRPAGAPGGPAKAPEFRIPRPWLSPLASPAAWRVAASAGTRRDAATRSGGQKTLVPVWHEAFSVLPCLTPASACSHGVSRREKGFARRAKLSCREGAIAPEIAHEPPRADSARDRAEIVRSLANQQRVGGACGAGAGSTRKSLVYFV